MENSAKQKAVEIDQHNVDTYTYAVTGTFHGSIVEAKTEGEARRIFHKHYNGESIIHIKKHNIPAWAF